MKTALVTGATGFLGRRLCEQLGSAGWRVAALARSEAPCACDRFIRFDLGSGREPPDFGGAVDAVFHLASRAHALAETPAENAEYERINVRGTRALVSAAQALGVRALVYVSSVKVFGEGQQRPDRGLNEVDKPAPDTPYGESKLAAEAVVAEAQGIPHRVVLRPALLYGPGIKGNLARMWSAVAKGRFPPIPETHALRSMLHRDDLCAALAAAAEAPAAAGRTYLVTDGSPLSSRAILDCIRAAQHLPPLRISVPVGALRAAASVGDVIGRLRGRRFALDSDSLRKLIGPAWFDSARIGADLGWKPSRAFADSAHELGLP